MAKLETVIKEAIARGARRQVRVLVLPLRREVFRLRRKVGQLQSTLTTLKETASRAFHARKRRAKRPQRR